MGSRGRSWSIGSELVGSNVGVGVMWGMGDVNQEQKVQKGIVQY